MTALPRGRAPPQHSKDQIVDGAFHRGAIGQK
jgi:hypothetical protein